MAHTTALEPGGEYVFPGLLRRHLVPDGDMMVKPHQELHREASRSGGPVFNSSATPLTLKRGTLAGVLQPAILLKEVQLQSAGTAEKSINQIQVTVPNHLQALYAESCANLPEESRL